MKLVEDKLAKVVIVHVGDIIQNRIAPIAYPGASGWCQYSAHDVHQGKPLESVAGLRHILQHYIHLAVQWGFG